MAGCGTVAVEAAFAGRAGLFSDIDPLACLITKAKARPVDPDWLDDTVSTVLKSSRPFAKPGVRRRNALKHIRKLEESTHFGAPPNVFHWFMPYVVVNICKVLQQIAELESTGRRRDSLLAIFASVIRRISRADPHTASGLEVTRIRREALASGLRFNIEDEITKKTALLVRGYRQMQKNRLGTIKLVRADAKRWSETCSRLDIWPDLIITSPCYMSAIEYWRRHKLEYFWLGLIEKESLNQLRHEFLGMGTEDPDVSALPDSASAMYSYLDRAGFTSEATELARYFNDTSAWIREISKVLKKTEGSAYVVVGSNSDRGRRINTALAIQELAKTNDLTSRVYMRYRITNYHMQYPTKGSRIRNETVLKLRV
jgi:hypothetical protein